MTHSRARFLAAVLGIICGLQPVLHAANFVMNGSDSLGQSSFNSGQHWTGGAAPAAGNTYQTSGFLLRTPANASPVSFAGDSLEVQTGGSLRDKTAATVTVNNLIVDNGSALELTQPNNVNNATAAGTLAGGITLNGTVTVHAGLGTDVPGETFTLSAPVGGVGAITTTGSSGNVILTGTNSFSGGLTANGGTVFVDGILSSSGVTISSGTLGGNGVINGAVLCQAGGTLQPGLGSADTSTLTVSNTLTLAGTAWCVINRGSAPNAAKISGLTTATFGGTLIVTNAGVALQSGDSFRLFGASTYAGSFSAVSLPALGAGLTWNNTLSANGTISVIAAASARWTNDASSVWSAATNWAGGAVANGTDATADFSTINLTADRTVTLDSSYTIGNLTFGDTVGAQNWLLNSSGGSGLTLAVSSGAPAISVTNNSATMNLSLAGTAGLTKAGGGILNLSGANTLTGAVTVNNGTMNVSGSIASTANTVVGNAAGNAVLGVSGTIAPYFLIVGNLSNAVGAVYQTGGTINSGVNSGFENLSLGNVPGSFGYFDAAGGTYSTYGIAIAGEGNNGTGSSFAVAGNGIFEVNGGIVNNTGWIVISRNNNSTAGTEIGVLNVFSGSLTYAGGGLVGPWDTGESAIVNILGGTVNCTANVGAYLGTAGNPGILNLNGGLFEASVVTGFNGPGFSTVQGGQLNFNGGTLQAYAANAAFIQVTTATIYGGGATIDNNGNAITVSQPLLAPTGKGIYSPAGFTGGAGYVAPPIIVITNAPGDTAGSGATAIAQINPATGILTNVLITCPGVNYTATPIFVVSGGGATTPATITGGAVIQNPATGGLNAVGAGTLTLAATNTYLGTTVVSNGTVILTGSIAGGAVVANGGTLAGNGSIGGAMTNQAGGTLQPGLGGTDTSGLTVGNRVVLAGSTIIAINRTNLQNAARISGITTLTEDGLLTVSNVGPALQASDTFKLFNAATYANAFAATALPALSPNLVWSNTLALNGSLTVVSTLPPTNSAVTNLAATQIFATSATLNGQVLSAGGSVPFLTIFYGTNNGGTNVAAWSRSVSLGQTNGTFGALVTALATNTTYYFAAFASNSAGVSWAQPSFTFTTLAANPAATRIQVLTYHYDNTRQGVNTNETLLTPANVNTNTFGKLFSYSVDGYIYTEPLIMTNVAISGQGTHDVVFAVTEHGTLYAFDANDNSGTNGGLLWKTNLGITPLSANGEFGNRYCLTCFPDIVPEVGVTGTPVIDPATGTIYVNMFTRETTSATTNYIHRLHAIDVTTGGERPYSPEVVSGAVAGTGVDSSGGVMTFNAKQANQRPALCLANGTLYVGYAGYADTDPYHGWLFAYNATNFGLKAIYNTTPNASAAAFGSHAAEGGIWMGGGGICVDTNNNLYFETGNGSFSANTNGGDYADSFMRISTTNGLAVADYFTPYDQATLAANDTDLGACGPLLLPDSAGSIAHPHLIVGIGKSGKVYLLDRDTMTTGGVHYQSGSDGEIVQSFGAVATTWSPPSYWNGLIYCQPSSAAMKSYSVTNAAINTTATATAPASVGAFNGGPVISANGTQNGIVWLINGNSGNTASAGTLYAFNATNISQLLWSSAQLAARDGMGNGIKMTTPTVAGGKVYVGAQYTLSVYGMQVFLDAPIISPGGAAFTNAINISISDASAGASVYYTLDGTTPTGHSILYSGAFQLTSNAVVKAIAIQPGAVSSAITSASFVNTAAQGSGIGLKAEYFTNATSAAPFAGAPVLVQTNATVNFNWTTNGPGPLVGPTNFTVRWTGSVQPQFSELFTLYTTADDGVRLYLNGQLLIDDWNDKTSPTTRSNSVPLVSQQLYTIELDYYQKISNASATLSWSSASVPFSVVPQTQLYPYTNPPPAIALIAPTNGASYTAAASVTMTADADTQYNPLSVVNFYTNGNFLASVTNAPYTLTASGLGAGGYALTAVAVDGSGLSSTTAPVNITVVAGTGQPYGLTNRAASPEYFNLPATFSGSIPALLSQTGVFSNTPGMIPAPGLISYAPNTPLWSDGALKTRYVSVPNSGGVTTADEQIAFAATGSWTFPAGTVFVKTFQLNNDTSNTNVLHRLETRLLVRDNNGAVYGVTYKWRADNSDADLLTSSLYEDIAITNASGMSTQTWYYPSPSDCLQCHTPVANYVLGLSTQQLNGNQTYGPGVTDNQLRTMNRLGLFNPAFDEAAIANFEKLSAPGDLTASYEQRARSYLDANCAQCHQPGGAGITFDARYDTPLAGQHITNYPASYSLGYDNARIIANQDVWRSMIWQRINTTNNSVKMPTLARALIDTNAVAVLAGWINSLPGTPALPPPAITPDGGLFFNSVGITLQAPDTNAAIYYTLDGTLPKTNSMLYSGAFMLTSNAMISASAFETNYLNSVTASALFLVQPLQLTAGTLSNGVFRLQFLGAMGSNYVLQATTNFATWIPLATNPITTNVLNFVDPKSSNFPNRFYRVLQQ